MKKTYLLFFSLFCIGTIDAQITDLFDFNGTNGQSPIGSLTLSASGSVFYGMTYYGGANLAGEVFAIDTDGTNFTDLHDFNDTSGSEPYGSLILSASGTVMYGMSSGLGNGGYGNVFSIHTDGSNYRDLMDFNNINGANPYGSLTLSVSGNILYGMVYQGGPNGDGGVFAIDTDGTNYRDLLDFNNTNGRNPFGSLILSVSGNILYGMTYAGGLIGSGTVFALDTDGTHYKDLQDFNGTNGSQPSYGQLTLSTSGTVLYGITSFGGTDTYGTVFSLDTSGTIYHDLLDFNVTNGQYPQGSVTLSGKVLYGMSLTGGAGSGTLFSIDTDGSAYHQLFNFDGTHGANPHGAVTIIGNALFGLTENGGLATHGNIFRYRDTNIATSIKQLADISGQLSVYPNPNNGVFCITLSHPELVSGSQTIEIFNVLGEKVYDAMLKQVQHDHIIDLSSESNGVYLYRVITEDGSLAGEGKIVIAK